jgi:hypothetical protein
MYANEPEMAKKWEKEEAIKGKLRNLIKQEIKSVNNESTKEYGKTLDKIAKDRQLKSLSKKDRDTLVKIAKLMKRANESKLEATTTTVIPPQDTSTTYKKSTQKAIDIDDEDDEKSESMAAPFRRRNSRGLGRVMKVGLPGKKTKGYWMNDIKNLKPTEKKEKGKTLWTESVNESDLGLTYKKGKTVKVTHKKSGKELIIIDKPNVKKEYEKIGYFTEGQVNELSMAPFSSQEARAHINSDIKDMSKHLGKASQQVIKIMMDGVRKGKYTAMDISRGVKEGPAARTHFGEMTFIQSLWTKMREKFRRYSKDRKLS